MITENFASVKITPVHFEAVTMAMIKHIRLCRGKRASKLGIRNYRNAELGQAKLTVEILIELCHEFDLDLIKFLQEVEDNCIVLKKQLHILERRSNPKIDQDTRRSFYREVSDLYALLKRTNKL